MTPVFYILKNNKNLEKQSAFSPFQILFFSYLKVCLRHFFRPNFFKSQNLGRKESLFYEFFIFALAIFSLQVFLWICHSFKYIFHYYSLRIHKYHSVYETVIMVQIFI